MEVFYHRKIFTYQRKTNLLTEFCVGIFRTIIRLRRMLTARTLPFKELGSGRRIVVLSSANQIKVFSSLDIEGDILVISPFEKTDINFTDFFSQANWRSLIAGGVHNFLDLDRLLFLNSIKQNVSALVSECVDLIVFNDHSFFQLIFLEQARCHDKVSHYFQHAPIELDFPQNHFTYSYLWSKRDSDIYDKIGSSSKHKIIGMHLNEVSRVPIKNTVGVAINMLDDLNQVKKFIQDLEISHTVLVRPHPAMTIRSRFFLTRIISSEDYWVKIESQYAGWSGVHFDALARGIQSLPFPFLEKHGLVLDLLKHKNDYSYLIQTRDSIYKLGYVRNSD